MLLGDIRQYLQKRGTVSLQDVATHFDIAPDTARFALNYWQKQGKVIAQASSCDSNACGSCQNSNSSLYVWKQTGTPIRWFSRMPKT